MKRSIETGVVTNGAFVTTLAGRPRHTLLPTPSGVRGGALPVDGALTRDSATPGST